MHRLSNLSSLKNELQSAEKSDQNLKVAVFRSELETTAKSIEVALNRWEPEIPPHCMLQDGRLEGVEGTAIPELPLLNSILHSAMAYRHSSFTYLYRTVYEYMSGHPLVQYHVHTSLVHCSETVDFEGPMGALLWPLFVAACDALSNEDRALARRTFDKMKRHQGMANIETAWAVIQEVWRQQDDFGNTTSKSKDPDLWRKISRQMEVCVVLG